MTNDEAYKNMGDALEMRALSSADYHMKALKFLEINKECFAAQFFIKNPEANPLDYVICYAPTFQGHNEIWLRPKEEVDQVRKYQLKLEECVELQKKEIAALRGRYSSDMQAKDILINELKKELSELKDAMNKEVLLSSETMNSIKDSLKDSL